MGAGTIDWWNRRSVLVACVLMALVPLIYPPIPPLVDLPGHMGRYAVQLDPAPFARWFAFRWQLIGNLGVDILIEPMGRLFGVELGTKLIVMTIPAIAVGGMLWIAREVHDRIPPTTFFALPLAWGHPFIFGFVNFSLAMALALLAFALWLRMARTGAARWRSLVFLPLALIIWTAHTFGWGVLGVLCFSAELVRQRDRSKTWVAAGMASVLACLPLAVPLIPMLLWRSTATDMTGDWFNWPTKALWIVTTLRDRWVVFDLASVAVLAIVIRTAVRSPAFTFSRHLSTGVLVLLAVFILLPRIVFGSAYADMRMTPYLFALAILAIRPKAEASSPMLQRVALIGLAFFAARMVATTASMTMASMRQAQALTALDHIPQGARVAALVRRSCALEWSTNRMEHLPAMVLIRRHGFANDQWSVSGTSLMTVRKDDAPNFVADPSQLVVLERCRGAPWLTPNAALAGIPRAAFDFVWLIDLPQYDVRLTKGMTPVWRNGPDVLYRIDR